MAKKLSVCLLPAALSALLFSGLASGQVTSKARSLVSQGVNDSKLRQLVGNTRPEATGANDRGRVDPNARFDLLLQLQRSPEMQAAADAYATSVSDPHSPNFRKFLNPGAFATQFGIAAQDLAVVQSWLTGKGFAVGTLSPNMALNFSGTARQIESAFHTELHHLNVGAESHVANITDPSIPEALSGVIAGLVKMNDFNPKPHVHMKAQPNYTYPYQSAYLYALVPADLQTIYNINPALAAGYTGKGQTVMVVEDTDLYTASDWTTFRATFGMTRKYPFATLATVHPQPVPGGPGCADPGVNGDGGEAILDAEWSSAAAPNAAIVVASCLNTTANFGGFIAIQNVLAQNAADPAANKLPNIISISYGESESSMGTTFNAYVQNLYMTAAAAGVSIFTSSGDSGADTSDQNKTNARYGINVSGFTSSTYDVSVGGTDFADTFYGTSTNYWSQTNSQPFGSALSYVPEIPWNGTCASQLFATYFYQNLGIADGNAYGMTGFCNQFPGNDANAGYLDTAAGGGGPSGCVTGTPGRSGIADGSCAGRAKPAWQSAFGVPSDGVRDVPDIALFASNGFWNHYYVFCYSDPTDGYFGYPCAGQPPSTWAGAGGTSFAAPILAGIQALINQYTGNTYAGLPNPVYYQLANAEYGAQGSSVCNSTALGGPASNCVFYDITLGDNDIPCRAATGADAGLHNCYMPSGTYGVLSISNNYYQPAYLTATGYDYPTGIGTVNVWNLMQAYKTVVTLPSP